MEIWLLRGILDILSIGIIYVSIRHHAKKGFVEGAYHLVRWILCFVLAGALYPVVTAILTEFGLLDFLAGKLEAPMLQALQNKAGSTAQTALPGFLGSLLGDNSPTLTSLLGLDALAKSLAGAVAKIGLNLISVLLLLAILLLITWGIGRLLHLATKLPVIHQLNTFLGGTAGLVFSILYLWLLGLAVYLAAFFVQYPPLSQAASESYILGTVNAFNFVLNAIVQVFS